MGLVNTLTLTVPLTKDTGRKINNTVKEKSTGQMAPNTQAITSMEKRKDMVNSNGLTDLLTRETS